MRQTNNGPIPNAGEVKQILNFLKEIVSVRLTRLIKLLLTPCCDMTMVSTVTCNASGEAEDHDVSITLDNAIPGPSSVSVVFSDSNGTLTTAGNATISADGATITVTRVVLPAETYTIYVVVLYGTNDTAYMGVYRRAQESAVVITDCP